MGLLKYLILHLDQLIPFTLEPGDAFHFGELALQILGDDQWKDQLIFLIRRFCQEREEIFGRRLFIDIPDIGHFQPEQPVLLLMKRVI